MDSSNAKHPSRDRHNTDRHQPAHWVLEGTKVDRPKPASANNFDLLVTLNHWKRA